jgi:SNF family Na+-dependent transporter
LFVFQVASGAGLTFIAFTEAIIQMPAPHVWAILFFMMLITLGFGSMFGTLEGVVTPLFDSKIFNVKKPYITGTKPAYSQLNNIIFILA